MADPIMAEFPRLWGSGQRAAPNGHPLHELSTQELFQLSGMPPASLAAPRLDEFLQPAAILANCERVAALRAALATHAVP